MKKYKLTEYITFQPSKIKMTNNNKYFTMPSIYIPRAHFLCNKTETYSKTINEILGYDCVSKVTIIPKTDQKTGFQFVSVFVNFKVWPRGENADNIYLSLINNTPVVLKYSDTENSISGYWKCFLAKPRENNRKQKQKQVISVDKNDDDSLDKEYDKEYYNYVAEEAEYEVKEMMKKNGY